VLRPRGGRTSKIHALANAQGPPVAFVLTPGNVADISVAATLLDDIAPPRRLLADKAYDADHLRQRLEVQGTEAVIPSSGARRHPYPLNRQAYRGRNVIERMFCRMKDWRRIATRYDRLARNFLSAIAIVASVCFWIT
jgi:transposase